MPFQKLLIEKLKSCEQNMCNYEMKAMLRLNCGWSWDCKSEGLCFRDSAYSLVLWSFGYKSQVLGVDKPHDTHHYPTLTHWDKSLLSCVCLDPRILLQLYQHFKLITFLTLVLYIVECLALHSNRIVTKLCKKIEFDIFLLLYVSSGKNELIDGKALFLIKLRSDEGLKLQKYIFYKQLFLLSTHLWSSIRRFMSLYISSVYLAPLQSTALFWRSANNRNVSSL